MKRNLVFLIFVFFWALGYSQHTFNGYIITIDNDTIFGKIGEKYNGIKFWEPLKERVEYNPVHIKGYALENGKRYMTVYTDSGEGFGPVLVDGYYRLVYIEIYSEPHYTDSYIRTANDYEMRLYGRDILYSSYIIYKGEKDVFYVNRKTFKGRTADFFSDYPELHEQIISKKLKFKDLTLIVNKYNMWQKKMTNL